MLSANDYVANAHRSLADKHRSDRPTGLDARFNNVALSVAIRIGLEFEQLSLKQDGIDENVDPLLGNR